MGHPTEGRGNLTNESLVRWLRQALRYLYDPARLRRNRLFQLFGLDEKESPSALRNILVNAIQSLKPDAGVSPQSQAWRTYWVLSHRYLEQFSQSEVATNLGLSVRQLRREEKLALQTLADYLWAHYDLRLRSVDHDAVSAGGSDDMALGESGAASREQELAWLKRSFPSEPCDVAQMIQEALGTIGPLMEALGVRAEWELPEGSPRLAVQRITIQQALMNVLTAAVRSVPGGQISIEAEAHPQQVCVCVHAMRKEPAAPAPQPSNHAESLEMARQLVTLSGGSLEVLPGEDTKSAFVTRLILPAAEQLAVLVIDDNADTLQLFQRYLADSHYYFIGARDPEQALALAEELAPQIIVADIMLPGIDGWELLGRLREHPQIRGTPIIVCTILPQEQLALTLGAAAFLRKPFTQAELLSALDRQASLLEQESC
jgi:CheY-like chemotaxis protein